MQQRPIPSHPLKGTPPKQSKRTSLLYYLIIICCFGNLLPYIITTSVSCSWARGFIRKEAMDHLISVRDIKKKELEDYFFERRGDARQLSTNVLFQWAATSYIDAFRKQGIESADYQEVERLYGKILSNFCDAYLYYDVLLIDIEGNVVCSAKKNPELGKNVLKGRYATTHLAEAFTRGKTNLTVGDMRWYEPYNGPALFVSAPIKKVEAETPLGVLVLYIDGMKINEIMTQRPGLKQSGETYLVGEDLLMRSDSRFTPESEVLKMKVDTTAVREALAGKTDARIIRDYRNVKALSTYTPFEVAPGVRWALIAEIDKAEALALESGMIYQVVYMTAAMFPIWGGIIFAFYRLMSRALFEEEEVPGSSHRPRTGQTG